MSSINRMVSDFSPNDTRVLQLGRSLGATGRMYRWIFSWHGAITTFRRHHHLATNLKTSDSGVDRNGPQIDKSWKTHAGSEVFSFYEVVFPILCWTEVWKLLRTSFLVLHSITKWHDVLVSFTLHCFFPFFGDLKLFSELTKRTAAGMPGSCGSFGRCS